MIELFRLGLAEEFFRAMRAAARTRLAMASSAMEEVHFYRDDERRKIPIGLSPWIGEGYLEVFRADAMDLRHFSALEQKKLGKGDLESLALVSAKGHSFCTADEAAIRVMRRHRLEGLWLPLEDLFEEAGLSVTPLPPRHMREFWRKKLHDAP